MRAKTVVCAYQADTDRGEQPRKRIAEESGRAADAGRVARPQPEVRELRQLVGTSKHAADTKPSLFVSHGS